MNKENPHTRYVKKPLPLITPRIEFELAPRPPLPILTARTEFRNEDLTVAQAAAGLEPAVHRRVAFNMADDQRTPSPPRAQTPFNPSTPPSPASILPSPSRQARALIPSPKGEPGRPNSGGFSIVDTLVDNYSWTAEEVDALTDAVNSEVVKKLDTTISFRGQDKGSIAQICRKMQERAGEWPELSLYQDCWPVISMIKLRLKSKSESSRRRKEKDTIRRVVAAAGGRLLDA